MDNNSRSHNTDHWNYSKLHKPRITDKGHSLLFVVIPIILLSGILRLYRLGTNSLWYDEVATITHNSLASLLADPNYPAQNMPLYFAVTAAFGMFGDSGAVVRLPAALFGILTIIVIYGVGCSCFNARVGLFASLVLAVSPFHLYYSQEARPYSLLMLLGIASTYCLFRSLRQPHCRWCAGYVVLAALGLYTHLYMAFVLLVQNLFLLWHWWRTERVKWTTCLLPQAAILLLFSPWLLRYGDFYVNLLRGTSQVYSTADRILWMPAPTIHLLARILADFFYKCFNVNFVIPSVRPDALLMGVIKFITDRPLRWFYLFLIPVGLFSRWKRKEERTYALFFAMYLAVPLAAMYLISFETRMLTSRYASFTFPAFCILLALGIDAFSNDKIKAVLLAGIVAVSGVSLINYYFNPQCQKTQWRDAARYVQEHEHPGDVVLFHAHFVQLPFDYYYRGNVERAGIERKVRMDESETRIRLREMVEGHDRVWLILSHDYGSRALVGRLLDERYLLSEQREFKGIRICLYVAYGP